MLLITLLINYIQCGTLWPTSDPIQLSISNRYEYADYTFNMIPDTTIPSDGQILVIFPSQYLSGLGIDLVLDSTCSVKCSISDFSVTFNLTKTANSGEVLSLKINNIKNPEAKGGTGNFILRSILGQNVFDENRIFATIGISDYAQDFNSMIIKIDENSTNIVGKNSLYNFYIKSPIDLPEGFYIQITSPLDSDLTTCKIIPYNDSQLNGTIKCSQGIVINGLPAVTALYTFGLQINFKNPSYSQTTDDFRVIAFRNTTTMAYAWRSSISGLYISSSSFINISLISGSNNTGVVNDYTLSMKLSNTVPTNGSIIILLPDNFELSIDYYYVYVNSGITSDDLQIDYTLYNITISNFDEIPQYSDIIIVFRIVNPQISGLSDSFIIQTTYDGSSIIDQCQSGLGIQIINTVSYTPVLATLSNPYAGSNTDLQFIFTSTMNTASIMIIDFGTLWQYQTTTPLSNQCTLNSVSSQSCSLSGSILTIQFYSTISNSATILLSNLLKAPSNSIDQFIVFQNYDVSNALIESGSVKLVVNPKLDSSASFTWIGLGQSTSTVDLYGSLYLTFTPQTAIPAQVVIADTDEGSDETTADEGSDETNADETNSDESTQDEGTTDEGSDEITYPTLTPPTPHGEIWIQFGPLLTWNDDLGITQLYCLTDVVALTNYTIDCKLYEGSSTSYPEIRILNFDAISANTAINVKVTGICNPQLTPIQISIFSGIRQYSNRIAYDYATSTIALSTVTPLTEQTVISSLSISATTVGSVFNLVFQPTFSTSVSANSIIRIQLPGYDTGFLQDTTTCTVDSTDMSCYNFLLIDWVEIQLTSVALTSSTITLTNLNWPSTSTQIGYIHWTVFQNKLETDKAIVYDSGSTMFPAPTPNDFTTATISSYQSGRGYPGQIFNFTFSTANKIPSGATMKIIFPSEFDLSSSNPTPTCNGYVLDSIVLDEISSNTAFIINCIGIKTPLNPSDSLSDGWSVYIYVNGRTLNKRDDFFSYTYSSIFTQGTISILSISVAPQNIEQIATYTLIFQPENSLLSGSSIEITFPSINFAELPYPPNLADCQVTGGVNSFESCLLDGSTFIIILNENYNSGTITFRINNIQNPSDYTTDGFIIQTYYDSVLIDSTDESTLLNRTVTLYDIPDALVINTLEFAPQNMGVPAIYDFNISISTATITGLILITFPTSYDQRLGDNLKTFVNQLSVDFSVSNRILTIESQTYSANYNSILVEIQNIINPNTAENSNTGQFRVGIQQNTKYIYYNNSVGVLEMSDPPGWLYLQNISLSNQYSRWTSQYIFNMTLFNVIPTNGYLQMDFPDEYDISDQTAATCSFSSCTFTSNVLKAYTDYVNGFLQLSVNIENPLSETTIPKFILKSKDNKQIVEQSYPNLDPFSFVFTYSGPLIYINNDEDITIPQGTESPDILFTVNYPMTLNMSFTHTQTGNFIVTPKKISFSYTKMSTTFRIQVPSTTSAGTYYIYWKTFGEESTPIYTPIKKTKVIITTDQATFSVTTLYSIPANGNSLVLNLTTTNAPYDTSVVTIQGNDATFYLVAGQQQSSSINLTFGLGINSQTFMVYQNYTELYRETQLDILNEDDRLITYSIDNSLFNVPSQQIVTYIDATQTSPTISDLKISSIGQYQVTIAFSLTQISQVYYMYCLNKTDSPDSSELLSLGPPLHQTTLSQYGTITAISITTTQLNLDVIAETDYAFYIIAQNQEGLLSDISYLNFTTSKRNKIAQFTITASYTANQAEKVSIMNNLAFILSLPSTKVTERVIYTNSARRILSSTTIQLYLIPYNNTDNYPTPKTLLQSISTDKQFSRLMKIYLPNIVISSISESTASIPNITTSTLHNSYLYDCEIEIAINTQGYIYAIASQYDESTPFQIFKGLNNVNVKVPSANIQITNLTSTTLFNISNLEPNNTYSLYLISASILPEYPDLSTTITTLTCSTQKLADRAPEEISYAFIIISFTMIIYI